MKQKRKVVGVIIILGILSCILLIGFYFKNPTSLSINGTFKAVDENTNLIKNQLTFDERDSKYYIYFHEQSSNAENHGNFKKLENDLYIIDGGTLDGKLVRLFSDYMNVIDLSGKIPTIRYEKISEIPTIL